MDLKLNVLRSEVKRYRSKSVRITERLLALTEVTKRRTDSGLSDLECQRIGLQFAISARTLRRWVACYKQGGAEAITPRRNTGRKAQPVRGHTAKKIVEYRRLYRWGAEVIAAHLRHDHGVHVGRSRIERYLKKKGLLLAPRRKKKTLTHTRVVQVMEPGHHTQIDVKYVTKLLTNGEKAYTYSFVDHASRWRFKRAYDSFGPGETKDFMQRLLEKIPFWVWRLQSDNGIEFTYKYVTNLDNPREHALERFCREKGIRHVLIPPGEKELQGLVERNHRQDDDELYHRIRPFDLAALNRELDKHTIWCNSRRRRKAIEWQTSNGYLAEHERARKEKENQLALEIAEKLIAPFSQAA